MKYCRVLFAIVTLSVLAACVYDPNTRRDFDFPIERGDIEEGQLAFTDLGCHQCHSVAGTRLPEYPFPSPVQFQLGGPTSSVRSYAELMTSVMNPNYHISSEFRAQQRLMGEVPLDSPMPNFDHMSLAQLFDIVAFLDSKYQVIIDYE